MIGKITLKFGANINSLPLSFNVTPVTIFVGPNNSGKSRILKEIESYCRRMSGDSNDKLINQLEFISFTKDEIEEEISKIKTQPELGQSLSLGHIIIEKLDPQKNGKRRSTINHAQLIHEAQNLNQNIGGHFSIFMDMYTIRLDGTNRLSLLGEQPSGDLQKTATNHLAHLFLNNKLRAQVSKIVYDAFSKYFVIDPTGMPNLRVRLSEKKPKNELEEKSWSAESVLFHSKALEIVRASDGVKAFIGIITTLLAGDPKIALIDEPEAFLHPALASKLGKEISLALKESRKRLFISTHSSNFLMGCIQSTSPLNIVRLTFNKEIPTARILPQEKILPLLRNPLLRSTGILNGLFYESVIVTEADSDRAFYQEINERLLDINDPRGIPSCLFINAQNKQTVWDIVKPLRELGIPALGIVDIDVLKDGGTVWKKVLDGAFIPPLNHAGLIAQRTSILSALMATGKNMKTEGGIDILEKSDKEALENLLKQLGDYGVLVVSIGELEKWLSILDVSGHGSQWLIKIFEKMGDIPEDSNYLSPTTGDVWDFIGQAKNWLSNTSKKGIPE